MDVDVAGTQTLGRQDLEVAKAEWLLFGLVPVLLHGCTVHIYFLKDGYFITLLKCLLYFIKLFNLSSRQYMWIFLVINILLD